MNLKNVNIFPTGEEVKFNKQFMGKENSQACNILDATWKFKQGVLSKKNEKEEINRYLGKLQYIYPNYAGIMNLYKRLYRRFILN